jgi:MinD-like ATPase involved in chromosome partitioning or flagellar assembly
MSTSQGALISFYSGKGGVGKTSLCASIGKLLATHKHRVLFIDLDLGWRNLDFLLKVDKDLAFDLSHVFQKTCSWQQAKISLPFSQNSHLIAGTLIQNTPPQMKHVLEEMITQARCLYDYILIDLGSGFDEIHEWMVSYSDIPIVISTTDHSSMRSADKILGLLDDQDAQPLWILNQFPYATTDLPLYSKEMNYAISAIVPYFSLKPSFWSSLFFQKDLSIYEKISPYLYPLIEKLEMRIKRIHNTCL